MISFSPQVQIGSDSWAGNALRFASEVEAQGNVDHLVTHVWEFPGNRAVGSDFVHVPPQRVTLS